MFRNGLIILILAMWLIAGGVLLARSERQPAGAAGDSAERAQVTTGPHRARWGWGRRLTAEQQAKALEFLKETRPEHYERLLTLREDNPRGYHRALRMAHRLMKLPSELRQARMQMWDARIGIWKRIRQIRAAEDASEKEKLKEQLRRDVAEHFEAEQRQMERRLAHLEEQIGRMRQELKDRQEQREQIISERLERWLERLARPPGPRSRRGPKRLRERNRGSE